MMGGKELAELIEKSSHYESELQDFLKEMKARVAGSDDPQEKVVLGGLINAMENFLSLNLSQTLLEKVPEEGNA
jgi:hypothetical protein